MLLSHMIAQKGAGPMDEMRPLKPHSLFVENRSKLSLTGVTDLESFDEETIYAVTEYGNAVVRGVNLQITRLDLDAGEMSAEGEVESVSYSAMRKKEKKSFFRGV